MNKRHLIGYPVTALMFLGVGIAGNGGEGAPTTARPTSAATVTVTADGPSATGSTVAVTPPAVTETVDGPTVTETAEGPTVTETVTPAPEAPDESIPGDGTFEVGVDVQAGTYVSDGSVGGCYWARLSGSDGFDSIIDNNFGEGQMIVTIKESDRFFETSGCEPWARRSG
ncbi:hypothetical protein [Ornithinimicrobium cryptoxanthini]|uniref:Secreted protein n=1 Tax=Ornithinimicrobium cryptoxanthini TaxID=2934161 RepID=A0ABY4YGJ5_9MICO|nr:hypothetical protein [Ornithinimicrobium cryptoxanthini]USQ75660.1 hypothetical protein NF557_13720 [Ornithinimicrobium cryptoxanthini]